jgi:hypothetical protein
LNDDVVDSGHDAVCPAFESDHSGYLRGVA